MRFIDQRDSSSLDSNEHVEFKYYVMYINLQMAQSNKRTLMELIVVILHLSSINQSVMAQIDTSKIGVNNDDALTYEYTVFNCTGYENAGYCGGNILGETFSFKITNITLDSDNAITIRDPTQTDDVKMPLDTLDFIIFTDWDYWETNAAQTYIDEDAGVDPSVEPIKTVDNGIEFFNLTSYYRTDFNSGGLSSFTSISSLYYEKSTGTLLHMYGKDTIVGGPGENGTLEFMLERTGYVPGVVSSVAETETSTNSSTATVTNSSTNADTVVNTDSTTESGKIGFLWQFTITALVSIVIIGKKT